jgi:hypothetical protein
MNLFLLALLTPSWLRFLQISFATVAISRNCTRTKLERFNRSVSDNIFAFSHRAIVGPLAGFPSSAFQLQKIQQIEISATFSPLFSTLNDSTNTWNSTSLSILYVYSPLYLRIDYAN